VTTKSTKIFIHENKDVYGKCSIALRCNLTACIFLGFVSPDSPSISMLCMLSVSYSFGPRILPSCNFCLPATSLENFLDQCLFCNRTAMLSLLKTFRTCSASHTGSIHVWGWAQTHTYAYNQCCRQKQF